MLAAFTAGLLLITVSELGDKTFFIAMILALKHSRRLVLAGVIAALALMTVLSVFVGQLVRIFPPIYLYYAKVVLFLLFGMHLLYCARKLSDRPSAEEEKEAVATVAQAEAKLSQKRRNLAVFLETFTLTFVAEWGDRTQFATIALAAAYGPVGVTLGAILGHSLCAAIAVYGSCALAAHFSERLLTAIGGGLFLLFGAIAWMQGPAAALMP